MKTSRRTPTSFSPSVRARTSAWSVSADSSARRRAASFWRKLNFRQFARAPVALLDAGRVGRGGPCVRSAGADLGRSPQVSQGGGNRRRVARPTPLRRSRWPSLAVRSLPPRESRPVSCSPRDDCSPRSRPPPRPPPSWMTGRPSAASSASTRGTSTSRGSTSPHTPRRCATRSTPGGRPSTRTPSSPSSRVCSRPSRTTSRAGSARPPRRTSAESPTRSASPRTPPPASR